jgi:hypothetical protein
MIGITLDRRLLASTAGFIAAYTVATYLPSWTYYAMAASNLVLSLNVLVAWSDPRYRQAMVERGIERVKQRARRREARRRLFAIRLRQRRERSK